MTDDELIAAVKADKSLRDLVDAGSDQDVAAALNAALPAATPVTVLGLATAAPQTLSAIAAGVSPLSEMEVIASRIREGDADGIARWADVLMLLGKMPPEERVAVGELVATAAVSPNVVSVDQVSAAFRPFRQDSRSASLNWSEV